MAIMLVSFALLGVIIMSTTSNRSKDMMKENVARAEASITGYITGAYAVSGTMDFSSFIYFGDVDKQFSSVLDTVVSAIHESIFVIITDEDGKILKTTNMPNDLTYGASVPPASLLNLSGQEAYQSYTDLNGFFPKTVLVSGQRVLNASGTAGGYVFVCSAELDSSDNRTMLQTLVIGILWVTVAAFASTYFITDKIVSPLKQMSNAAKEFSQGKFDVRVPVTGEDEVAELATAFNNMAIALEKNEDMRRTFLSNVSHDLRTPLTSITGFVESMLSGAIVPEKQNYYLEIILSEAKRLSRLVMSLLDISKMQAGDRKFVKTNFDICEMAREIIISFEQKLESKKLDVEFDCQEDRIPAFADRDAIYQVLYNLCDNAVKFSKEGGKYRVSIIEKEEKIFVSVYNEGQGIAKEELPFVFERFYKSDKSRGLDRTGVGLGLFISKTIMASHGEEIWVNSIYGQYCEFVFTLTRYRDNEQKK